MSQEPQRADWAVWADRSRTTSVYHVYIWFKTSCLSIFVYIEIKSFICIYWTCQVPIKLTEGIHPPFFYIVIVLYCNCRFHATIIHISHEFFLSTQDGKYWFFSQTYCTMKMHDLSWKIVNEFYDFNVKELNYSVSTLIFISQGYMYKCYTSRHFAEIKQRYWWYMCITHDTPRYTFRLIYSIHMISNRTDYNQIKTIITKLFMQRRK